MPRTQISELLMIGATVALLGALPRIADALEPAALTEQNAPATQDAADTNAPHPVKAGNITYITGGIGDVEKAQLEAMAAHYNLRVLNMTRNGSYVGATHIIVRNPQGNALVDLSSGPIFLAQLPPGHYMLTARNEGVARTEQIRLSGSQPASLNFTWN